MSTRFALSSARGRLARRAPLILASLLLAPALSNCAATTARNIPETALLTGCLVPLTGDPTIDAPRLEAALQACNRKITRLREWAKGG